MAFTNTFLSEPMLLSSAQVVLTVGLPGCGKSTYAHKLVQDYGYAQLELDMLREELGDRQDQSLTGPALALRDQRLALYVAAGTKFVISDTNANATFRRELVEKIMSLGVKDTEILVINFQVSVEVAKDRNANREFPVPEFVIDRMAAALADGPAESDYRYFWGKRMIAPRVVHYAENADNSTDEYRDCEYCFGEGLSYGQSCHACGGNGFYKRSNR